MSYRLIDSNAIAIKYPEVNEMPCVFADLPDGMHGQFINTQLEQKKGKWIKIPEFCGDAVSGFIDNHFSCSECKKEAEINSWGFYILSAFCPHCGADMRGGTNDEGNI